MRIPRIWPGRALAMLFLAPGLLSLGVFVTETVKPAVLALDLVAAAVALADLASLRGASRFRVSRQCGSVCSLGEPQAVTLAIENRSQARPAAAPAGRRSRRLHGRSRRVSAR